MVNTQTPTIRHSLESLQCLWDCGYKAPLEDVILAFHGIMNKKEEGKCHSPFFTFGSYHGAPFEDRSDAGDKTYWGGYCNHGNILFPTWHRAYCYKLEKALQAVVPHVGLPYLDEASASLLKHGLPKILTMKTVEVRGKVMDNPLYSYKLEQAVEDTFTKGDNAGLYTKPAGYETVRFPYSGLVGTPEAQKETEEHNSQYSPEEATKLLNSNIQAWLRGMNDEDEGVYQEDPSPNKLDENSPKATMMQISPSNPNPKSNGVQFQLANCLEAPTYGVFSNGRTANAYWKDKSGYTFSLESPHDAGHISIGGFAVDPAAVLGQLPANGDMGENNTAAFDPLFFLHHCFIDRMFWLWQKRHGCTDKLVINDDEKHLPGMTTDSSNFGPSVGQDFGEQLTLNGSGLYPFMKDDDPSQVMTSEDVFNIEALGYDYGPGSLEEHSVPNHPMVPVPKHTGKKVKITGITRDMFKGSFVIYPNAILGDGRRKPLTPHPVFSRHNIQNCANCMARINVDPIVPLTPPVMHAIEKGEKCSFRVRFHARHPDHGKHTLIEADHSRLKFEIIN